MVMTLTDRKPVTKMGEERMPKWIPAAYGFSIGICGVGAAMADDPMLVAANLLVAGWGPLPSGESPMTDPQKAVVEAVSEALYDACARDAAVGSNDAHKPFAEISGIERAFTHRLAQAAIAAYLAAMKEAGMVVVPAVPTWPMVSAGGKAADEIAAKLDTKGPRRFTDAELRIVNFRDTLGEMVAEAGYRAMIAVAGEKV